MAASSSTAASTSVARNANTKYYHVLLHCRGVDVQKTFARSLYLRLISNGLTAFLHQEPDEIQQGYTITSQIKHAIGTASAGVVIFSERYAESTWCLDELVMMWDSNKPIIPVFYGVTPAEVRWPWGKIGKYAQALENLERKRTFEGEPRYDSDTIEKWRNALSNVADINGFELEASDIGGEVEMELVDKVVQRLLELLEQQPQHSLNFAQYRPGLAEKLKDFEEEVLFKHHQSGNARVLGIFGLGGVGKTTLAKEFFDRKKSDYSRFCFLSNVRENAVKGFLTSLQRQLLESLTRSDVPIDMSIDQGKEALKKHLSSNRVLVILDDVDDKNQIEALLPVRTDLPSDSLLVMTSRDEMVMRNSGVEKASIYKLTGLNRQHSRELFCSHAFSQPLPYIAFECLVDNFLEYCNGLPLLLKMFGALLFNKYEQSDWEDQLDKLRQLLPTEIQEKLKISYDSLTMEQKEIFLDSACFFIGHKRDTAIRIWDGSGWKGSLGFQTLQSRCLLELDSENNIHMHDHLRDYARTVADTSLPRRLWQCNAIKDMLEQLSKQQVTTVRGIRIVLNEYNDDDDAFGGIDMRTLQLVDIENAVFLERVLTRHSPSLIWLRWSNCHNTSLPPWIPTENLTVLEVSGSKLNTLWEDESQAPMRLRELKINAPLSDLPKSIGQLNHLERMVVGRFLSGQVNLTKLPEEFSYLKSLKDLVFTECSKMKSLPDSFGSLENLRHIDLSFCRNLERLPDSFGGLQNLQHINLSDCHDLERLPDSVGDLCKLQHIDLRGCHNLERLPESFGYLIGLRYINLSVCHDLKRLPNSFGNLRYLQHIDLQGCHNLKKLPNSFGNLKNLQYINLSNCHGLERLPYSFGNLSNLQKIDLSGCHNLEKLPSYFRKLNKLKFLDVEGCSNLIIETIEISDHLQVAHQRHLEQLYLSDAEH